MEEYKEYNFFEALKAVLDGKRITKLEWNDKRSYLLLREGLLMLKKAGTEENKFFTLTVSEADMTGLDWIILPDSK